MFFILPLVGCSTAWCHSVCRSFLFHLFCTGCFSSLANDKKSLVFGEQKLLTYLSLSIVCILIPSSYTCPNMITPVFFHSLWLWQKPCSKHVQLEWQSKCPYLFYIALLMLWHQSPGLCQLYSNRDQSQGWSWYWKVSCIHLKEKQNQTKLPVFIDLLLLRSQHVDPWLLSEPFSDPISKLTRKGGF